MNRRSIARRLSRLLCGNPDQDLHGKISAERSKWELADKTASTQAAKWYRDADCYLAEAKRRLDEGDAHEAWGALQAAQRSMLLASQDPVELHNAAVKLHREMEKVSGWRFKAMTDLICDGGRVLTDFKGPPEQRRLFDAIALRDDYFQNNYFKIMLRGRHLGWLSLMLWIGIATVLLLSFWGRLPTPFKGDPWLVLGVVLFGALGAMLSVAQNLLAGDVSARIPAQRSGAFLIWMRPGVGAAAALISLVVVQMKGSPPDPTFILSVAVAAGFSERFILGAIDRVSPSKDK